MRRPFPIGWRGKAKRYAVGAYSLRAAGGLCRACRRRGFRLSEKIFKRVSKIFSAFAKPDTPIWYTGTVIGKGQCAPEKKSA